MSRHVIAALGQIVTYCETGRRHRALLRGEVKGKLLARPRILIASAVWDISQRVSISFRSSSSGYIEKAAQHQRQVRSRCGVATS
jgi:hypothetical protein